ncbi:hypothetical protein AVEN_136617-1 [Araneus ventricosus]|uniref:Uncharacterized protein n=1 Tax=Araneus ventricosus TaxID=182803 RepID=A0A4Y2CB72_ARAVE|nr:hypothetical protein AVEN_136617-1 [Araneus ventricosus]
MTNSTNIMTNRNPMFLLIIPLSEFIRTAVAWWQLRHRRITGWRPNSTQNPSRMWPLVHIKSDVEGQTSSFLLALKFERSADAGLVFGNGSTFFLCQNSPRVASK